MENNNLKISVVTVCYNAVDTIEETMLSVLNQTYDNIEYIIIDGGSTDGTVDIIKKYTDRLAYWVSEPDKGIYDAMNKGIDIATGDYINFMNSGDSFVDNYVLTNLIPIFKDNNDIVSGAYYTSKPNGKLKKILTKSIDNLDTCMPICHQATFIKLQYHKQHKFNIKFKCSADYDFFYKARKNDLSFKFTDMSICKYEVCNGVSYKNFKRSILERRYAWDENEPTFYRNIVLRFDIIREIVIRFIKTILRIS